jgi:threonine dehydrogenase-like Zn-dependent dehydrogenase
MAERIVEREKYLVPVTPELREVAVLVEPLTIMDKALREVDAIQQRMPWRPGIGKRALVLGAGPVGLLGAMAFLLRGCETTIVARSPADTPNARLAQSVGAKYVSSREVPFRDWGPFDVIYEAAGAPRPPSTRWPRSPPTASASSRACPARETGSRSTAAGRCATSSCRTSSSWAR